MYAAQRPGTYQIHKKIEAKGTTSYVLEYMVPRARGEFVRYILAYSGADWKDDRFAPGEMGDRAKNTPMGMFPVLTVDEQKLSQSLAIASYLAAEHGLAGKDEWEAAKALELAAGVTVDTYKTTTPWLKAQIFAKDTELAKKEWQEIKTGKLAEFISMYEKFLEENGGEWFVGEQLTWADLTVAEYYERLESCIDDTLLDSNPKLRDHYKRVHKLPQLKNYLKSRPKTPF